MLCEFTSDSSQIQHLDYCYTPTQFGEMLTAWQGDTLCFASFTTYLGREKVYDELRALFPHTTLSQIDSRDSIIASPPEKILLVGTPFRLEVWRALLSVERGTTITYSQLAARTSHPTAVRAVATGVGHIPISVIIPCHRILPASKGIGNYHSGTEIKRLLLEAEGALP